MHDNDLITRKARGKTTANADAFLGHAHDHRPYSEDYFLADVVTIDRITPSMIRAVLKIAEGERLVVSGHPDEWVRVAFQPDAATAVTLPVQLENGKWGRLDGSRHCPNRPYTIRYWDPVACEMTLDFVVHDGGVASTWARNAKIGDVVGICNPEGRFWMPETCAWLLLIGDLTALPALSRILEEKPISLFAIAHVEVPCLEDRQNLDHIENVSLTWHTWRDHQPSDESDLAAIARSVDRLPDGPGYIYIAGEATAVSDSRKYFRDILGFDKSRIDAIGYWIEGQSRA